MTWLKVIVGIVFSIGATALFYIVDGLAYLYFIRVEEARLENIPHVIGMGDCAVVGGCRPEVNQDTSLMIALWSALISSAVTILASFVILKLLKFSYRKAYTVSIGGTFIAFLVFLIVFILSQNRLGFLNAFASINLIVACVFIGYLTLFVVAQRQPRIKGK